MIQTILANPGTLITTFGLLGVLAVVFIETGLLAGFFLPGDSLLFTAGVLAAQTHPVVPLWLLVLTVPLAAIAGDQCGYAIGAGAGATVFERPGARRLGRDHVGRAQAFFDAHGAGTVVLARFVPVLRTLAPVLAGVTRMPHRVFTGYSVLGALAWGAGVPVLGNLLGGVGFVRAHIDLILVGIVVVSLAPVLVGLLRNRLRRRAGVPEEPAAETPPLPEPVLAGRR